MRTHFQTSFVQKWTLLDLSGWQECLIRQQMDYWLSKSTQIQPCGMDSKSTKLQIVVTSVCAEAAFEEGQSSNHRLGPLGDAHVVVMSPRLAERQATVASFKNGVTCETVKLLWDWGPSLHNAYARARGWGMNGVIRNPMTLRSWIQVCVRSASFSREETHPILSTIALPCLKHRT